MERDGRAAGVPYEVVTMSTAGCVKAYVSDSATVPSTNSTIASGLASRTALLVPTPCSSPESARILVGVASSNEIPMMLVPSNQ